MMEAVSTSPLRLSMLRKFNTWYTVADGNWSNPNTWMSNGKRIHSLPQPGDDVYIDHNIGLDIYQTTINNLYVNGQLSHTLINAILTVNGNLQAKGTVDLSQVSNANLVLNGFYNFINSFEAGNSSTVTYSRPSDQDVMSLPYQNLKIYNIGIKYLTAHTIINGNLNVNDYQSYDAFLECGPFNLTVYGTSSFTADGIVGNGNLGKSGNGNLLFVGNCNINANTTFSSNINSLEFRGGFSGSGFDGILNINCPVYFTTNSQIFSGSVYFNDLVMIIGQITLTNNGTMYLLQGVNGDNNNSTLTNNYELYLSSPVAMNLGVFNYMNGSSSLMGYAMNDDFALPFTSYNNLSILGTGTKSLSGNTNVLNPLVNNYSANSSRLDCGPYDLVINGNTTVTGQGMENDAALIKTGSGKITFVGDAFLNCAQIGFNSDVTLEFRGNVNFGPYGSIVENSVTISGPINLTTSSKTISGKGMIFNGSITISGGITATFDGADLGHNISGTITGASNTDTMKVTGAVSYLNPIEPMQVGVLDCNYSTSKFYYSASNNQNIVGGTYGSLFLNGSGTKTLLGNIIIISSYLLTSPATLDTNEYTISNS